MVIFNSFLYVYQAGYPCYHFHTTPIRVWGVPTKKAGSADPQMAAENAKLCQVKAGCIGALHHAEIYIYTHK